MSMAEGKGMLVTNFFVQLFQSNQASDTGP